MSYDYYLQAHLNEDFQEISTEMILAIFEKYTLKKHEDYIELLFDDLNSCTVFINTNDQTTQQICINRPCGDQRLGECIYRVMQLGNFVFFEPDGKQPIILNAETENNLPPDMIESLGKPAIAMDLKEFLNLYNYNR